MKEIHQALNSLGPLIASSVFSLRPKEPEDRSSADLSDLEMKPSIDPFPTVDATPEYEMFGQYRYTMDAHDTGGSESHNVPINEQAGFPLVNTEVDAPLKDYQCSERKHSICVSPEPEITKPVPPICIYEQGQTNTVNIQAYQTSPAAGFPLVNTETDVPLKDYQCSERKHSICVSPEPEITKPVPPICMYEQGETNAVNIQAYQRSPAGNRNNYIKKNKKLSVRKSTSNKLKASFVRRTRERKSFVSQLRQGGELYLRQEEKEQRNDTISCETNVVERCRLHPENEQNRQNNSPAGHQQADNAKASYACTDCGKIFFKMSCLIMHQRVHTGERPFHCTLCGKSFTQNGILRRHHQLHTGDRPFKCNLCEKTFIQKFQWDRHKRRHTNMTAF